MSKQKVLVSACLVGKNCKYNGKNNKNSAIIDFLQDKEVFLVCPEVMGGLSIPRLKSEIKKINQQSFVYNEKNEDVTNNFLLGANKALQVAIDHQIDFAILKQKSPSCGCGKIYNGEFNQTVIEGYGLFAHLLKEHNIHILTEEDF